MYKDKRYNLLLFPLSIIKALIQQFNSLKREEILIYYLNSEILILLFVNLLFDLKFYFVSLLISSLLKLLN